MKKYLLVFAACAFVFFGPQNGQAAIYNPVTEHWYALVDAHEGLWGNPDGDDNRFHWRSWTVAEANAVASGGHLVTIDDAAENAWLVSNFGSFVVGASYIGLYQETGSSEPDSGWLWLSLNTMNYTNWSEEEPNNALDVYGYENWGAMYLSASPADRIGRWFDVAYQSDKLDSEFLRYGSRVSYKSCTHPRCGVDAWKRNSLSCMLEKKTEIVEAPMSHYQIHRREA